MTMNQPFEENDALLRMTIFGGEARVALLRTTRTAQRAGDIHSASDAAIAAMSRMMTGTLMLGMMMKETDASITAVVDGGGAGGRMTCVSHGGDVKISMQNARAQLPPRQDGAPDVAGLVGRKGTLTVIRDYGVGEPYIGKTELVSGELGEDFAAYYTHSEQTPSIVSLGSIVHDGLVVAMATSLTRLAEFLVCAADSRLCRTLRLKKADFLAFDRVLLGDFIRFSVPAAANDVIWGLAFSIYSVILGHLSSDIVAANSVAAVVRNLGTVVCFGVSSSAAIILGKTMGDNRLEEARIYAGRFLGLSVWTALAGGALILLGRPLILRFMHYYVTVTDTVRSELDVMLLINSYYILGQSLNTMLICGIFRAGGDVRFGLRCDVIAMWLYAVPVGLISAFVLRLPEMWVYFILCLDEFIKMPVVIAHYRKGDWLRNITRELG